MHVATNYINPITNEESPNYELFMKIIGKYPDRIRNLFFLYAVVLRAINRAEPILKSYDYTTLIDP
jgi:hypothetical protein